MLAVLDQTGHASHCLGGHALGVVAGDAHGDGTVDGGLEDQGEIGRARGTQGGRRVHVGSWQVDDVADALEDPGDEALGGVVQGGVGLGHDSHGLADQSGVVAHSSDDAASAVLGGVL